MDMMTLTKRHPWWRIFFGNEFQRPVQLFKKMDSPFINTHNYVRDMICEWSDCTSERTK